MALQQLLSVLKAGGRDAGKICCADVEMKDNHAATIMLGGIRCACRHVLNKSHTHISTYRSGGVDYPLYNPHILQHSCNISHLSDIYPTSIRQLSDSYPTGYPTGYPTSHGYPTHPRGFSSLQYQAILKAHPSPTRLSDTYPTPIRQLSDSYPTPIRQLSDSYPTPIRQLSDSYPTAIRQLPL